MKKPTGDVNKFSKRKTKIKAFNMAVTLCEPLKDTQQVMQQICTTVLLCFCSFLFFFQNTINIRKGGRCQAEGDPPLWMAFNLGSYMLGFRLDYMPVKATAEYLCCRNFFLSFFLLQRCIGFCSFIGSLMKAYVWERILGESGGKIPCLVRELWHP